MTSLKVLLHFTEGKSYMNCQEDGLNSGKKTKIKEDKEIWR